MTTRKTTESKPTVKLAFPLHYRARSYQWSFFDAMRNGKRRAALVWHRRAGKDITTLNWTIEAMLKRPGSYYYFFPTYKLGKRILWDGIQSDGRPFLGHFPGPPIFLDKNETELKITLRTLDGQGFSHFQIIGADKIDQTGIGTNPVGAVFSEYSIMNPRAWDLVRPILAENRGWSVFCYTPRGKNHGFNLWTAARQDPDWYTSLLTVNDTMRDSEGEEGGPVVPLEAIEAERRTGMREELIQQEFYCSFEGAMMGAYFSDQIGAARDEGRVTEVGYDPTLPVDTAWDFGIDDETAIWFSQTKQGRCIFIDYMEASDKPLSWYIEQLRRKPYVYGQHYAPHDAKVREFSTGNTRVQFAESKGLHFQVLPKLAFEDGIDAVRRLLPLAVFDAVRCERGIDALASYRRDWDDLAQTWKLKPVHDWSSHAADAMRQRAVAWHGQLGPNPGAGAQVRASAFAEPESEERPPSILHKYTRSGRQSPWDEAGQLVELDNDTRWWR